MATLPDGCAGYHESGRRTFVTPLFLPHFYQLRRSLSNIAIFQGFLWTRKGHHGRDAFYFQSLSDFPSWTSRVRSPSPASATVRIFCRGAMVLKGGPALPGFVIVRQGIQTNSQPLFL